MPSPEEVFPLKPEGERIHLALLADAEAAWDDIEAGRTMPVDDLWKKHEKKRRKQ